MNLWKAPATVAGLAAAVILLGILMTWLKPNCPGGSTATLTRDGWYCTVKIEIRTRP